MSSLANHDLFRKKFAQDGVRFASLGSGSGGNATVVVCGDTMLLVDCGFNVKQTTARFRRLGIEPEDLTAILVTHEHADHMSGVVGLAHRFDVPVYASYGTHRSLRARDLDPRLARPFTTGREFRIGDARVNPVPVPHDAREPTQYVVEHDEVRIGILTDIGYPTPFVIESYRSCNAIFVESNHDPKMLAAGSYPPQLKRRIASELGHLSNEQTAQFLDNVMHDGLAHVVIGHVSEQNNSRERLREVFARFEERITGFAYANQAHGISWIEVATSARSQTA